MPASPVMYQAANRWIRKPTPVITDIITRARPSTARPMVGWKLPTAIQVHRVTPSVPPE